MELYRKKADQEVELLPMIQMQRLAFREVQSLLRPEKLGHLWASPG